MVSPDCSGMSGREPSVMASAESTMVRDCLPVLRVRFTRSRLAMELKPPGLRNGLDERKPRRERKGAGLLHLPEHDHALGVVLLDVDRHAGIAEHICPRRASCGRARRSLAARGPPPERRWMYGRSTDPSGATRNSLGSLSSPTMVIEKTSPAPIVVLSVGGGKVDARSWGDLRSAVTSTRHDNARTYENDSEHVGRRRHGRHGPRGNVARSSGRASARSEAFIT